MRFGRSRTRSRRSSDRAARRASSLARQPSDTCPRRPKQLGTWRPPREARRFHAALALAKLVLSPERTATLRTAYGAYAHFHPYLALRETERVVVAALDSRFRVPGRRLRWSDSPPHERPSRPQSALRRDDAEPRGLPAHNAHDRARTHARHPPRRHLIVVGDELELSGDRGMSAKDAKRAPSAY